MNKHNKVKQLNRDNKHRRAMLTNMVTSLFQHERIESSLVKLKVARSLAEKIITRAKKNLGESVPAKILHNKREVMKRIKDRTVVVKLFEDIAPRFKDRKGGYTRIYKLVNRDSDNTVMGILELVDRKNREQLVEERKLKREERLKQKEAKKESISNSKKAETPKKEKKK
jgi:large subunit ribosomal protein L17